MMKIDYDDDGIVHVLSDEPGLAGWYYTLDEPWDDLCEWCGPYTTRAAAEQAQED